jgi:hypothetical protein
MRYRCFPWEKIMRWRGKLLVALIVYAGGFFTAIYVLAPADRQTASSRDGNPGWARDGTTQRAGFDAPAWAASARAGMTKAISFAEEQALRLAEKIKTSVEQTTPDRAE